MSGQVPSPGRLAVWPFGHLAGELQQGTARRLAGYRAKASGGAFETWLAKFIFSPAVARGALVRFDKLDAPTRATWDAARSRVAFVPIGVGGCDFLLLAPGGRYIACEAKSTDGERFYRSEIEPHQIEHLDTTVNTGGRAFLALRFSAGGSSTVSFMPWQKVPWQMARSAPSVTPADCARWPLRNWQDLAGLLAKP